MNDAANNELSRLSPEAQVALIAAREAVSRAIERHRRMGESIVIWRDGKVVIVPPEEIPPRDLAAQ